MFFSFELDFSFLFYAASLFLCAQQNKQQAIDEAC